MLNYQTDVYNGRDIGSYRFTDAQRNSLRLIVDIEILSRVGEASFNFRYPLPQSFYGYAQIYSGSSVARDYPLQYGRQRILDQTNWLNCLSQLDRRQNLYLNQLFNWVGNSSIEIDGPLPAVPESFEVFGLPHSVLKVATEYNSAFRIIVTWLPFDVLSPYGELQDTDTTDPTDGDDERPTPDEREPGDPYPDGFIPTPPNPLSDPRDFPEADTDLSLWGTLIGYQAEAWNGSQFITLTESVSLSGYRPNATIDASDNAVPGGIFQGKQTYFGLVVDLGDGTTFGPYNDLAGYTKGGVTILTRQYFPPS